MPSIKDLKKRIGSVKNTQQTTKAMKMVSAAKLRRAQDAILSNRPYARAVGSLMDHLLGLPNLTVTSRLMDLGSQESTEERRLLVVVVTSDRGLCGAFNSGVIRMVQRYLRENAGKYASIELAFLGKRGYDFFKTKKVSVWRYFEEAGGKVSFIKANKVAGALTERFLAGEVDEVKFIYNEFKNAASQRPIVEDFLPLRPRESAGSAEARKPSLAIVKPDAERVLEALLEKHFSIQAFRVQLESQAGEHGARMSAMENATKNAGEMIRKLTLQYNKQRQAGITKELLEIISGSESQKSA